jgi:hypothetical protein
MYRWSWSISVGAPSTVHRAGSPDRPGAAYAAAVPPRPPLRDRSAEQISRDRTTSRAVRLASRGSLRWRGERRLAAAVARAGVGTDPVQKRRLLDELADWRNATDLATIPLPSPWTDPTPSGQPIHDHGPVGLPEATSAPGVVNPGPTPDHLADLSTGADLPDATAQVPAASGLGNPLPTPASTSAGSTPVTAVVPPSAESDPSPAAQQGVEHIADAGVEAGLTGAVGVPATNPVRTQVHSRVPAAATSAQETPAHTPPGPEADLPADPRQTAPDVPGASTADVDPDELALARAFDDLHRKRHGRPASVEALKTKLNVGQPKATRLRDALKTEETPS